MKKLFLLLALLPSLAFANPQATSCEKSIGKKDSETLVNWCMNVSPATHPPCNAKNSCDLITDEIRRGCSFIMQGNNAQTPFYCLITTDSDPH